MLGKSRRRRKSFRRRRWVDDCKPDSVWVPKTFHFGSHDDHFSVPQGAEPQLELDATSTRGFVEWLNALQLVSGQLIPLFCLALHGVSLAPSLTLGAVGFYPAFSPVPLCWKPE